MKHNTDGSITELQKVRAASMPKNTKQLDTLLNATELTNDERVSLLNVISYYAETHPAPTNS